MRDLLNSTEERELKIIEYLSNQSDYISIKKFHIM